MIAPSSVHVNTKPKETHLNIDENRRARRRHMIPEKTGPEGKERL
jgi:hypothetical protein